jgi:hypothetical protein
MNLLLTAQVNDTDTFYEHGYLAVKHEFAEWCDEDSKKVAPTQSIAHPQPLSGGSRAQPSKVG